jgi:hypothetical protein
VQSATSSVFIAAVPTAAARLLRILTAYRPSVASSGADARSLIDSERFGLAILGVHFDGARMFELMSYIRASARNRDVPILCVLGVRGGISDSTLAMIQQTVEALGGCEFLDLSALPDDEARNALVLRRVARHLQAPPAPAPAPNTAASSLRP